MDLVICKCVRCDARLGTVANWWTQIGKKYITPVDATGDERFNVLTSGRVRSGEANTLVGGCQLQDAECASCHENLGQKCLESPVDHVFNNGQVIFRINSISLGTASDGRSRSEPKIQRVLQLRGNTSSTNEYNAAPPIPQEPSADLSGWTHVQNDTSSVESAEVVQIQADLEAQREDINRISATGYQVVSSFETAIGRVEQQVQQLKDSIDRVRNDRDGQRDDLRSLKSERSDVKWECQSTTAVSRLDEQLRTTDRVITELRLAIGKTQSRMGVLHDDLSATNEQLQSTDKVVTELRQAIGKSQSEMSWLRNELSATKGQLQQTTKENARMKEEMDETKQVAEEGVATSKEYASEVSSLRSEIKQLRAELAKGRANPPRTENSFSSHELDILSSNISKIGSRASHIESLQMDFDLFRTRVQRLEARASASGTSRIDSRDANESSPGRDELSQPAYGGSTRQKRPSTSREDNQALDTTPPKRVAVTSDYSSAPTTGDWQKSSPLGVNAANQAAVRRTKSGAVDKRSSKRASWTARA